MDVRVGIKKAECWRIDAFELWCWRRLLRVAWTMRKYNQSNLKEISPECSLEGLTLKLKLQYFGHLLWRADSFEKTLILVRLKPGGEGDDRGWDGWMASPTQWTWVCVNSGCWWWRGRPGVLWFMGFQRVRYDWAMELNWTYGKGNMSFAYALPSKLNYMYFNILRRNASLRGLAFFCDPIHAENVSLLKIDGASPFPSSISLPFNLECREHFIWEICQHLLFFP